MAAVLEILGAAVFAVKFLTVKKYDRYKKFKIEFRRKSFI